MDLLSRFYSSGVGSSVRDSEIGLVPHLFIGKITMLCHIETKFYTLRIEKEILLSMK